mmetsp:Transcript_10578/g.15588  ORF Transcript_10578/g.15588 Transcript_10578/m.15588 type:complete len:1058 (+) Transcript_10578:810-3983(+)
MTKKQSTLATKPSVAKKEKTKPTTRPSPQISSSVQIHGTLDESKPRFGLVRVEDSRTHHQTLPPDSVIYPISPGALLGRMGPNKSSYKPSKQVDIGIDPHSESVSRRQLEVISINPHTLLYPKPTVTFKVGATVCNPVGVVKFRRKAPDASSCNKSDIVFRRIHSYAPKNSKFNLNEGGVIEFDAYNRRKSKDGKRTGPFHVFRLVRITSNGSMQKEDEGNINAFSATGGNEKEKKHTPIAVSVKEEEEIFRSRDQHKNMKDDKETNEESKSTNDSFLITANNAKSSSSDNNQTSPNQGKTSSMHQSPTVTENTLPLLLNEDEEKDVATDVAVSDSAALSTGDHGEMCKDDTSQTFHEEKETDVSDKEQVNTLHSKQDTKQPPTQRTRLLRTRIKQEGDLTAKVGDRFRVVFDAKDMFGIKRNGWYFGTARNVKKGNRFDLSRFDQSGSYLIDIDFDDNSFSKKLDYPHADVEKLIVDPDTKSSHVYSEGSLVSGADQRLQSDDYRFAYDANPQNLFVGDLVECNAKNRAWHRGRVVKINEDEKSCDILYDHAEHECGIPFGQGNVRLIERAFQKFEWLLGMNVHQDNHENGREKKISYSPRKRKPGLRKGKVVGVYKGTSVLDGVDNLDCNTTPSVTVKIHFADGVTEEHRMDKFLSSLFNSVIGDDEMFPWPDDREVVNDTKDQTKTALTFPSNCSANIVSPIHEGVEGEDEDEHGEFSQDAFPSLPTNCGISPKKKGKELPSFIANSAWRALNTAEPHNGATLLAHLTTVQKVVPNCTLSQNLFSMLKHGPKSEGVAFNDPNRMELACRYISLLSSTSTFQTISLGPSSWDDVESCLRLPISETNVFRVNAEKALSSSATRRLGDGLQAAACAVGSIETLLKNELGDMVHSKGQSYVGLRGDVSKPTVRAILLDVREALKRTVRWAVQCWMRHGQCVIRSKNTNKAYSGACAMEAKRCLDSFGRIICYIAWLYCREEEICMENNGCSLLIKDCLFSELENKSGAGNTEVFFKKLKLWFVVSLDLDFASTLRSKLCMILDLPEELSIVTGGILNR